MRKAIVLAVLLAASAALAQESTSFKLTESTFNAGGHPLDGIVLESSSFRVTLDAIGDAVTPAVLTSASYTVDGGFMTSFRPPGEVANLHFTDQTTLEWDLDRSKGDYALYRGSVTGPFAPAYGTCQQPPPSIPDETATVLSIPGSGGAYFYLVTARNLLREEGTKGFKTDGNERGNPLACP